MLPAIPQPVRDGTGRLPAGLRGNAEIGQSRHAAGIGGVFQQPLDRVGEYRSETVAVQFAEQALRGDSAARHAA